MKSMKLIPLCLAFAFLMMATIAQAQPARWVSCASTAGKLDGTTTVLMATDTLTAMLPSAFTVTAAPTSAIPNLDYFIVKKGEMAGDSLGDAIVYTSLDGSFNPAANGFMAGDTFSIVPMSYDLTQIKRMVQSLLFDGNIFLGSCCSIVDGQSPVPGVCDSLNAAGIQDSSDINNAGDLVTFLAIFSGGGSPSLQGVKEALAGINDNINLLNIAGCSGGVTEACYAFDSIPTNHRIYIISSPTNVGTLQNVNTLQVFPNPAHNYVAINIDLKEEAFVSLEVIGLTGQKMISKSLGIIQSDRIELNTSNLATGVYLVKFMIGNEMTTHKIVVRH